MRIFAAIICVCFFYDAAFSQNAAAKKQLEKTSSPNFTFTAAAGANYTFKYNKKTGYETGAAIVYKINDDALQIGINYSIENTYYKTARPPFSRSEHQSEHLKIPFGIIYSFKVGTLRKKGTRLNLFSFGLQPGYLLKTKGEDHSPASADFHSYNLSGYVALSIPLVKHVYVSAKYSKDFFDNLEDKNLYDAGGTVIGKQKSKTNLASLSVLYMF